MERNKKSCLVSFLGAIGLTIFAGSYLNRKFDLLKNSNINLTKILNNNQKIVDSTKPYRSFKLDVNLPGETEVEKLLALANLGIHFIADKLPIDPVIASLGIAVLGIVVLSTGIWLITSSISKGNRHKSMNPREDYRQSRSSNSGGSWNKRR